MEDKRILRYIGQGGRRAIEISKGGMAFLVFPAGIEQWWGSVGSDDFAARLAKAHQGGWFLTVTVERVEADLLRAGKRSLAKIEVE